LRNVVPSAAIPGNSQRRRIHHRVTEAQRRIGRIITAEDAEVYLIIN
jgi:hypothetical protein